MRLLAIRHVEKKIGRIDIWGSNRDVDRSEHYAQRNSP
jgi:hypothetical protein